MLKFLVDENLNNDILRGLIRRVPELDIVRVQDVGLAGADDQSVLEWAAGQGRVLLTHDVPTITCFAYERLARAEPMPGVFVRRFCRGGPRRWCRRGKRTSAAALARRAHTSMTPCCHTQVRVIDALCGIQMPTAPLWKTRRFATICCRRLTQWGVSSPFSSLRLASPLTGGSCPGTLCWSLRHRRRYSGPGQAHSGSSLKSRAILQGPTGRQADVVTAWMVSNGQDFPHFITAYPG